MKKESQKENDALKVKFPTMLRKMWSGGEVQEWLDRRLDK